MNEIVIDVRSLSKAFEARRVLKSVDLIIERGQSVFICGANGAGKSTLIRIIAGLLGPDNGSVHICGHDVKKDLDSAKPYMGVISHQSMTYPDLTVSENLLFFAGLYGVKNAAGRVRELLEDAGLVPYRYDRAGTLSRGLLQRLAIARALIHKPTVLLADEPFTGLDRGACEHLVSVLKTFAENSGTIVMTTHDVSFGLRCCDRVVVLDESRLIFDGSIADLDASRFSQDYLSYVREQS